VRAILIFHLVAGLSLTFAWPLLEQARVVALWSDFQAFKARVASDEAGARILNYGGENPRQGFEQLLTRLWNLRHPQHSRIIGLILSITSALGLFLLSRVERTRGDTRDPEA
jgi:hypothetical protein